MRRIAFCFDGSWNGLFPTQFPTNVRLLAEGIRPVSDEGVNQIVYYDEGVGTQRDETFRGGAFGKGLIENLREAYRFLIFNYNSADELYAFGFSRGGFTAMAFIGLVRSIGILSPDKAHKIDEGFRLFQEFAPKEGVDSERLRRFRAENCQKFCVNLEEVAWRLKNIEGFREVDAEVIPIRYLGVWDAVGSLGWGVIRSIFGDEKEQFYDRFVLELTDVVESARHAVSIDEDRKAFKPTLWKSIDELNSQTASIDPYEDFRSYQQKWFPGNHGSVGGGGVFQGLSSGSLQWVLEGAARVDLAIDVTKHSQLSKIRYDIKTPLRNDGNLSGWRKLQNRMKGLFLDTPRGAPEKIQDLSISALRMILASPNELDQGGSAYRPANLQHLISDVEKERARFEPVFDPEFKHWKRFTVPSDGEWTLSRVAEETLEDSEAYLTIFEANRDTIDSPHFISPGDVLHVPIKNA